MLEEQLALLEKKYPPKRTGSSASFAQFKILAEKLNLTHFSIPVILVTGTNGKGSFVKTLENILISQNYNVASFTSPHLLVFNERIKINNQNIRDEALADVFSETTTKLLPFLQEYQPSFFEFITLAALLFFKKQKNLDFIILEVGMGGRFDATNVVDHEISVFTTIALDHKKELGNTKAKIAFEKAGIMRQNGVAIYSQKFAKYLDPLSSWHQAETFLLNRHFHFRKVGKFFDFTFQDFSFNHLPTSNLPLNSVLLALGTFCVLMRQKKAALTNFSAFEKALQNNFLPGRFQIFSKKPLVIFDVAHNPEAGKLLAQRLKQKNLKIIAICGMLKDKDIQNTLKYFKNIVKLWLPIDLSTKTSRGATASQIIEALAKLNITNYQKTENFGEAFSLAQKKLADFQEAIVVFGSFYTVNVAFVNLSKS